MPEINYENWKDRINSSTEMVSAFVSRKYGEGWIEEWEVNLDNHSKVKCFIDKDNIYYKVKYIFNEHNSYVPYRIISITPKTPPTPKKKYKLPVTWEVTGVIEVEAESLEEAIEYFDNNMEHIPLPRDLEYVDGSFNLSCRDISYLELFQSYEFDKT